MLLDHTVQQKTLLYVNYVDHRKVVVLKNTRADVGTKQDACVNCTTIFTWFMLVTKSMNLTADVHIKVGNDIGTSSVTVCLLRSENDLKRQFHK